MAYYPRIRDLREDNDKKQNELADYLGTTAQYYGLYEKGANEISFERAILLAKYYNVSLDYLAGLTNIKLKLSDYELSDNKSELLLNINNIAPEKRKELSELLRKIAAYLE